MARTAEDILEFDKLRELVRLRTTCAPGRRSIDALQFSLDREALVEEFALIREAREWLRAGRDLGFGALADPRGWLERIAGLGVVLEAKELLEAATLLETASWLRQQFREDASSFPLLSARVAGVGDFREPGAAVRRSILPDGQISDDASSALRHIRAHIASTRDAIQKALKQILRSRNAETGEDYVTLRGDRFVIPVRAENRRSIPGVMHGSSATGQTVFLEPLETLETNNQLVQLIEDESVEILRILRELTGRLQAVRGSLVAAADVIAHLDGVMARARFAQDFDAAIPEFSEFSRAREPAEVAELRLVRSRHPVLEDKLRREGREIVALTLTLGGNERVLVISGPNTGGKTVALKTTGLAALSAQCGIPVAAESAVLPLFDHLLVDIGDEQSIAADLSTFSSHMLNLKAILATATHRSLVLVDEMGTGTAPEEGAALAVALLDDFRAKHCIVLATTHHDRLKEYASTTPGVVNAAVEFDDINLRPTYRLMVGVPGGSSGIAIAQRLGISPAIIERARSLLSPESREAADLIAYLHRSRDELDRMSRQMALERRQLEEERAQLRSEWLARQQRRIQELEAKFAEMQKRFDENVARVVEAVKERELRVTLEKKTRRKVQEVRSEAREELNAAVVQTIAESQADLGGAPAARQALTRDMLRPGSRVEVRGFSKPVVLRRIDGASAEIEAGPLRMKIGTDEILSLAAPPPGPAHGTAPATLRKVTASAPAKVDSAGELNVIGLRVEEATERLDKYLDEAALANHTRVRIIHGHGTGALRKGIAEFLLGHPLVARSSFESEEHGGRAITVVELRS
jgi:DNA mismatch repair protein MutS2